MVSLSQIEGYIYIPANRNLRNRGRKLIVVLSDACIELVHTGHGRHELLNGSRHRKLMTKIGRSVEEIEDSRPDIVFQCLTLLLNSPLNREGLLLIYIQTRTNCLIEVSPCLQPPTTYLEFESLFATLLLNKKIRALNSKVVLLRIVKNDLLSLVPAGCRRIGFEIDKKQVDLYKYVGDLVEQEKVIRAKHRQDELERKFKMTKLTVDMTPSQALCTKNNNEETSDKLGTGYLISDFAGRREENKDELMNELPIIVFIGAFSKGHLKENMNKDRGPEEYISISKHPLTAALCCGKVCDAFERCWCY